MVFSSVWARWVGSFITAISLLFGTLVIYGILWRQSDGSLSKFYYEFVMFSIMISVCAGTAVAPYRHWKIADFVFIGAGVMFYGHDFMVDMLFGHVVAADAMEFGASLIGGGLAFVLTRGIHMHVPRHHRPFIRVTPR